MQIRQYDLLVWYNWWKRTIIRKSLCAYYSGKEEGFCRKNSLTNFPSETNMEWLVLTSPLLPTHFNDSKEKHPFTSQGSAFPRWRSWACPIPSRRRGQSREPARSSLGLLLSPRTELSGFLFLLYKRQVPITCCISKITIQKDTTLEVSADQKDIKTYRIQISLLFLQVHSLYFHLTNRKVSVSHSDSYTCTGRQQKMFSCVW